MTSTKARSRVWQWAGLGIGLALWGCGGGGSGSGGGLGAAMCVPDMVSIDGSLDGTNISTSVSFSSSSFQQLSDPSSYDLGFDGGGTLHLEWSGLVADGQTTKATGRVTMPSGEPRAGEELCSSNAALSTDDVGTRFRFDDLTVCSSGDSVEGSLLGCEGE